MAAVLMATLIGGVVWTTLYGLAGYYLGDRIHHLAGSAGAFIAVAVITVVFFVARAVGRREEQLRVAAEEAYPGPLTETHRN